VWLVRHGQTDWNLQRRYMSFSDRPLTQFGKQQAAAVGRFLRAKKIDVILHTGLARTTATAQAIAGARPIPQLCDEAWREANHGDWEGLTYPEVMQRAPADAARRFSDPVNNAPRNGESLASMAQRVATAWQQLGQRFPKQRIVIIAHGGSIQALLCHLLHTPLHEHWRWRIDAGSATGIDVYPSATIVRTINYVPKLI
jgi:2,3-bisphosphoglycerate-dependent phosphoglycerate mutase/probable phosphoglycerate mutase